MPRVSIAFRWTRGGALFACLGALAGVASPAPQGSPPPAAPAVEITMEGRLTDASGLPIEAALPVEVTLYDDALAGAVTFRESHAGVPFSNGYYAIPVGAGALLAGSLEDALRDHERLWMTVNVNGDGEMTPRIPLRAAPLAINARTLAGSSYAKASGRPNGAGREGDLHLDIDADELYVNTDGASAWSPIGGGAATFLELSDTPVSFGSPGLFLQVNAGGNALEFVPAPGGIGQLQIGAGTDSLVGGISLSAPPVAPAPAATAIGLGASAAGSSTVAIGDGALADTNGEAAIAMGRNATASSLGSIAIGRESASPAIDSLAIGPGCQTTSTTAGRQVAVGAGVTTDGDHSIAVGSFPTAATGPRSIAIGHDAQATGDRTIAIGRLAEATVTRGIAISENATANSGGAIAIGPSAFVGAGAPDGVALGGFARALENDAVSIGHDSVASQISSVALGVDSEAAGARSIAIGADLVAMGNDDIAIGMEALAAAGQAVALGAQASATGTRAIAIGNSASAQGVESIAIGRNLVVTEDDVARIGALGAGLYAERKLGVFASGGALTEVESNKLCTNQGATAQAVIDLPEARPGLSFTFVVQDADGMLIQAAAGDTIRIGASVGASGGSADSTTVGDALTLVGMNNVEWFGTSVVGSGWVVQ